MRSCAKYGFPEKIVVESSSTCQYLRNWAYKIMMHDTRSYR